MKMKRYFKSYSVCLLTVTFPYVEYFKNLYVHVPEDRLRLVINSTYPDMERIQSSLERNHEKYCEQKGLNPVDELKNAESKFSFK